MTARSVLLGLVGAVAICGATYFNDAVIRQTFLVGNHMPFSVFGGIVVVVLLVNPLLALADRLQRRAAAVGFVATAVASLWGLASGVATGFLAGARVGLLLGVGLALACGSGIFASALLARSRRGFAVSSALAGAVGGLMAAMAGAALDEPRLGGLLGLVSAVLTGGAVALAGGPLARRAERLGGPVLAELNAAVNAAAAGGLVAGTLAGLAAGPARACATGLLCAALIGGVTVAAARLRGGRSTFLAAALSGALAALAVGWSSGALLGLIAGGLVATSSALVGSRSPLKGGELATAMALTLAACAIPSSGLLRTFTTSLIMPHHWNQTEPGWRERGVINMLPDRMLARIDPRFDPEDIVEPAGLCSRLVNAGAAPPAKTPARRVWSLLGEQEKDALREARRREDPGRGRRASRKAVVRALGAVLESADLYDADVFGASALSERSRRTLERVASGSQSDTGGAGRKLSGPAVEKAEIRRLNRELLDWAFSGEVRSFEAKEDEALRGFVSGSGGGISFADIPWYAWRKTLVYWIPLVLVFWVGFIGLSLVVHQQWARNEQLPYPIASFANALMPAEGRSLPGLFKNRLFWAGSAAVLVVHATNYLHVWFPSAVSVPTRFDFSQLRPLFPTLAKGGAWTFFWPRLYFTVVAFAYLLPANTSLSLGIVAYLWAYVVGTFLTYGISFASRGLGSWMAPDIERLTIIGAYAGVFLTVVYSGRHHFGRVFARAVGLPGIASAIRRLRGLPGRPRDVQRASTSPVEPHAVWGARVFMAAFVTFVLYLALTGIDWQLAALYAALMTMLFVVVSRFTAETGVFFIKTRWFPCVAVAGFMGAASLGPTVLLMMSFVSVILMIDPRECLMPYVTNGLKLADAHGARVGRVAAFAMAAMAIGLAVALSVTLYMQYSRGANMANTWDTYYVPTVAFNEAVKATDRLTAQGTLETAEALSGWSRFAHIRPDGTLLVAFAAGMGLTLALALLRWRVSWWPLPPVVLALCISRTTAIAFAPSFLLGGFIKWSITQYGGHAVSNRIRPLFYGLVAGDMVGALGVNVVGAVYYAVTGAAPQVLRILPG